MPNPFYTTQSAYFLPRRAIANFRATVTIEEVTTDELEITQHPVQQGAAITDHAFVKPVSVSLSIMFGQQDRPLTETYNNLLRLQSSRLPFSLVTGKRAFSNMLIKSLSQTTDSQTENVLSLHLDLQQIIITSVDVVSVPPRSQQSKPGTTSGTENAGQKQAQPDAAATEKIKSKSGLASLFG